MVSPTVQQQYRGTRCPFQHYDIQSYTDKAPQCPSLSSYSTAYESEGGQGESHSQPLRAKAVTFCMKRYSVENLQELCVTHQFSEPRAPETGQKLTKDMHRHQWDIHYIIVPLRLS